MFNLYRKTEYVTGRNWGDDRSVYCLQEDDEVVFEGWELVKINLTQEQIDFLREIQLIPSEQRRQMIRDFGKLVQKIRENGEN